MLKQIKKYDEQLSEIKMIVAEPCFETDVMPALQVITDKKESYEIFEFIKLLKYHFIDGFPAKYDDVLQYWQEYKDAVDIHRLISSVGYKDDMDNAEFTRFLSKLLK